MNYIELINRFWVSHDSNLFGCTETALYFYLLKTGNLCGWADSFKRNNSKIQADLGITYPTLSKARNRLKQSGLIDFKSRAGSIETTYTFKNILKVSLKVCDQVSDEVCSEVALEVTSDTLYKAINYKQKPPVSPQKNEDPQQSLENRKSETEYVKKVVALFNENCRSLKPVKTITDKRIKSVMARYREHGERNVAQMISQAAGSDFLAGQNAKGWTADFDWIFKPENFVKVYEGKYDNKQPNQATSNGGRANPRLGFTTNYDPKF